MVIAGANLVHGHAVAQGSAVDIEQQLDFKPGTPKARAVLKRVAAVRDMVDEGFDVATIDLNDDGRKEIIVLARSSSYCGSGGCALVVLEQQGSTMRTLLQTGSDGQLGVTRQRFGAYRALAALDPQGRVAIGNKPGAPLHGKPLVYPMAGSAAPATTAAAPVPATTAPPAAEQTSNAARSPGSQGDAASIAGIRLGMSASDAEAALKAHSAQYDRPTPGKYIGVVRATDSEGRAVGSEYRYHLTGGGSAARPVNGVRQDAVEIVLSPPPQVQRVIAVRRSVMFGVNDTVAVESLRDQLTARHGKPALVLEDAAAAWFLDKSHRSLPQPVLPSIGPVPNVLQHCGNPAIGSPPANILAGSFQTWQAEYRDEPRKLGLYRECGTALWLLMYKSKAGTVQHFTTQLVEFPALIDAIVAARAFLKPQADAAKDKEKDAARKRGAPRL